MYCLKSLIEKLFFKKRWVLIATSYLYPQELGKDYKFFVYENLQDVCDQKTLAKRTNFQKRLIKKNWILFAVVEKKTHKTVAFYWAALPGINGFWHDNFVVLPGASLLCNAYVEKEQRSKGLYKYLIYKSHEYLFRQNISKIFTIVEKSNKNSFKANKSLGLSIHSVNYLIKFFGINIFSIFTIRSKPIMLLLGSKFLKKTVYIKQEFI